MRRMVRNGKGGGATGLRRQTNAQCRSSVNARHTHTHTPLATTHGEHVFGAVAVAALDVAHRTGRADQLRWVDVVAGRLARVLAAKVWLESERHHKGKRGGRWKENIEKKETRGVDNGWRGETPESRSLDDT